MVSLLCLISQRSQVQEGNHPSMWAISLGHLATEIAHFERMGLDGFSSNSLIFTREQAIKGREKNSLLVHAYYHTLTHSLFSLFGSFFPLQVSCFPSYLSLLLLLLFLLFYLFIFLSHVFLPIFSILLRSPLSCLHCPQLRPFFILPAMMGFYYFAP